MKVLLKQESKVKKSKLPSVVPKYHRQFPVVTIKYLILN